MCNLGVIIIDRHFCSRHQIVLVCWNVQLISCNTLVLCIVILLHRVAWCASSGIHVENREWFKTVNARNSIVIWSRWFTIWSLSIFESIFCCVVNCFWISLEATLLLNITPHILVIGCCFIWRWYAFYCINIELVWAIDANDSVIKWLLRWALFVTLVSFVQVQDFNSLRNDSGQVAIIGDPSSTL